MVLSWKKTNIFYEDYFLMEDFSTVTSEQVLFDHFQKLGALYTKNSR